MTFERGDVAKIIISGLLFLFFAFVATQIYVYSGKAKAARVTYDAAAAKLDATQKDNQKLKEELTYYLNPLNMAKELKARFNYREEGEKTLILVPKEGQ
jgi:hypothetical protein